MAPKQKLSSLKKGVNAKKAGAVKGGATAKPKETVLQGIVTRNHNLVMM